MAKTDPDTQPSLTRNQKAVVTALKGANTPLTAYDILGLAPIRRAGMKAPLTIYRALDKLIALGLVHRIESLNAFVHCGHGPHDHATGFLICTDCGTIEAIDAPCPVHKLEEEIRNKSGFKDLYHELEFFGRCPKCTD